MDADVSPALGMRFTLVKFLPDHLRSVKKLHYRKIILNYLALCRVFSRWDKCCAQIVRFCTFEHLRLLQGTLRKFQEKKTIIVGIDISKIEKQKRNRKPFQRGRKRSSEPVGGSFFPSGRPDGINFFMLPIVNLRERRRKLFVASDTFSFVPKLWILY